MAKEVYPIKFDHSVGRAFVTITGEINAAKISNTFLAIAMDESWLDGDKSVLWHLKNAFFPELFEFSDIFKTTQISKIFLKPGKSAFVVEKGSEMQKRVATFYKSLADTASDRKTELFFSKKDAILWLDS